VATPPYKGNNQPQADSSFWSGLGSWFGGGAPAYKGDGQPSSTSSGVLGTATPAYKPAPASNVSAIAQSIDPMSIPPGGIVVLVPRGAVPPCAVTEPQDQQQ
jgi:hypothetical protein